ncbi:MAG TPA: lysophospholipid acyltransferase family protein [Actinopolymorphaceae bacterium]
MSNPPNGLAYSAAVAVLRPLLTAATSREWRGMENIPRTGGFVAVANHLSYVDPLVLGHFIHDCGRAVRYLAKASLFEVPLLGRFLRSAGQIPVYRGQRRAGDSLEEACVAVERGECVVIMPEGTITRDPDLWPMVGRSGAARVALRTGCPVIPLGQWGPQDLLAPYSKRLRLLPRKAMKVLAGTPVDLDEWRGLDLTPKIARLATERIMKRITSLVEELRAEAAPVERFDPVKAGLPPTGNPHKR